MRSSQYGIGCDCGYSVPAKSGLHSHRTQLEYEAVFLSKMILGVHRPLLHLSIDHPNAISSSILLVIDVLLHT